MNTYYYKMLKKNKTKKKVNSYATNILNLFWNIFPIWLRACKIFPVNNIDGTDTAIKIFSRSI